MIARSPARSVCVALIVAVGAGCQLSTEPRDIRDLVLTTSISRTTIRVGETATLEMRLRNQGSRPLRLHFGSSCQILPYIQDAGGATVYPSGGGWMCLTVLTDLDIAPGEEIVRTVQVRGGAPAPAGYTGALLPPGQYRAHAELGERPSPLKSSNEVRFTVVE